MEAFRRLKKLFQGNNDIKGYRIQRRKMSEMMGAYVTHDKTMIKDL